MKEASLAAKLKDWQVTGSKYLLTTKLCKTLPFWGPELVASQQNCHPYEVMYSSCTAGGEAQVLLLATQPG